MQRLQTERGNKYPGESIRDITQLYRDGVRKTKAYLELNLARDVRKHFYSYIGLENKQGEG